MAQHSQFKIELEQEDDGRWIGEVPTFPGVMAYGSTRAQALASVQALALRVMRNRYGVGSWIISSWRGDRRATRG